MNADLNPSDLKVNYCISDNDLHCLHSTCILLDEHLGFFIVEFQAWKKTLKQYSQIFADFSKADIVKTLQNFYLQILFCSQIDQKYINSCREAAKCYAELGIALHEACAEINFITVIPANFF